MGYNKDLAILAQNSGGIAANLTALAMSTDDTLDTEGVMEVFETIRERVFTGALALAGVDDPSEVPAEAPRRGRSGGGSRRSSGGGDSNADPATVKLNFGKYRGKTFAEVAELDEGPEYIEWLSESSNNAFIKRVATEFIAAA